MAITIDDFNKIWASTSPLTPYSFSESNYKEGWNFIGSTPPSRQMWDFLQKQNDEKAQWLYNNKLSLSGGTMSGVIVFSDSTAVKRDVDNAYTVIEGASAYNRGAYLQLYGKDSALHSGEFALVAHNGTDNPTFAGSPNGTLKWNGKEIERVNASGTNYIRYESGLQICWGAVTITPSGGGTPFAHSGSATVTFPVAFSSAPLVFANINDNAGYWNAECQTQSTTGATISIGGYNTNQKYAQYFAIGKWN